ncbi:hypothetical protein D3C81_968050 [compost metagenome]
MDGGHQAVLDAQLAVQHLGHRRQAVGGARGVGDYLLRGAQHAVIDAVHHRGVDLLARRRDDHLARSRQQVRGGLLAAGEGAGALQHDIHAERLPGQLQRVAERRDDDAVAVYAETIGVMGDFPREAPMHAVELEQVGVDLGLAKVVDRHDLQRVAVIAGVQGAEDVAADAAKSVYRQADGHGGRLSSVFVVKTITFRRYLKLNIL